MKRFVRIAIPALALLAAGCKSNCEQLADQICQCQPTQIDRDNCTATESAQAGLTTDTAAQDQTCGLLVNKCECAAIDTPQGKENCGLANFLADGGTTP